MTIYSLFCHHWVDSKKHNRSINNDTRGKSIQEGLNQGVSSLHCQSGWATSFNYGCQAVHKAGFLSIGTNVCQGSGAVLDTRFLEASLASTAGCRQHSPSPPPVWWQKIPSDSVICALGGKFSSSSELLTYTIIFHLLFCEIKFLKHSNKLGKTFLECSNGYK